MARKNRAGSGPCVHCLAQVEKRTWDHVFPRSWYPDTTPENLELRKFPSCLKCNEEYGELEQDLLLRIGLCLDPAALEASGISAQVLRATDPECARNDKDRRIREARRRKVLSRTFVVGDEHLHAVLPGFGPRQDVMPIGTGIAPHELDRMAEKFARGLTYLHTGRLITPEYSLSVFLDPVQGELFEPLLRRFGRRDNRGPGVQVEHAIAANDQVASIFSITLWGVFQLWCAVQSPGQPTMDAASIPTPCQSG